MRKLLFASLIICVPLAAQKIPTSTALPGDPFFVTKTWMIGGLGNWDYLTIDPTAQRLYIAHGPIVQVVNIDSGELVAQISGFRDAHSIALDDTGAYAYVSDGQAGAVEVVDRRRLEIDSTIPIYCSPRSIAFDPASKLVFAICGANLSTPPAPRPGERPPQPPPTGLSHVVAIDTEKGVVLADIVLNGDFHIAQSDGEGYIYVSVAEPAWIAKLDAVGIAKTARQQLDAGSNSGSHGPVVFDWSYNRNSYGLLHYIPLNQSCQAPKGLAVDARNLRLFIACENQDLQVLNANSGDVVASLTTGPGDDVIGYDQDRGLIFVANGAGYGSLTIIRQDATTDSYAVIQDLPTRERARTIAVDSSTGAVYLVTDFHGVDLTHPGGIGTLRTAPINGSFQVFVIGH